MRRANRIAAWMIGSTPSRFVTRLMLISAGLAILVTFTLLKPTSIVEAQRGDLTSIDWPSAEFPTLQAAVNALRDGGRLRIAPGVHAINTPVVVQNKRIVIQGAGCSEVYEKARTIPKRTADLLSETGLDNRTVAKARAKIEAELSSNTSDRRDQPTTHLVGPRPERVVDSSDAMGLFNFIDGGGSVDGLKLTGFDAGIVTRQSDGGNSSAFTVTNTCIANSGRGVLALAPVNYVMQNMLIQNVLWNGISTAPEVVNATAQSIFTNVYVENAGNACMLFKNVLGFAHEVFVHGCGLTNPFSDGRPGIAVVDSIFTISDSIVLFGSPGIMFVGSHGSIEDNVLVSNKFVSMFLLNSTVNVSNNMVVNSRVRPSDGLFGDGIDGFHSTVTMFDNLILISARAGVANFGGFMSLGSDTILCAAFELEGEPHLGDDFEFQDRGGNVCGCPDTDTGDCVAVSAGLDPPDPLPSPSPSP